MNATKNNKIIASIFIFFTLVAFLSIIPTKKISAWGITHDPWNFIPNTGTAVGTGVTAGQTTALVMKEYFADMAVTLLVRPMINRIIVSTTNWINSGFQGSPGYITNPGQFFGDIADGVAGQMIWNNPNFRFMCSPFRARVQLAINRAYNQPLGQFQCTLTGVLDNFDGFMGDFSQGGWDGFITMTQNPQNNPIGLFTTWNSQLNQSVNSRIERQRQELIQNSGMLSYKTCPTGRLTQEQIDELNELGENGDGMIAIYRVGDCPGGEQVSTPGSVIKNQLDNVLTLGNQSLVNADEINELVGAFLGQLTNKIMGGLVGGLRSLSSSGGDTYGRDFLRELEQEALRDENRAIQVTNEIQNRRYFCVDREGRQGTSATPNGGDCVLDPPVISSTICSTSNDTVGMRAPDGNCYEICTENGGGLLIGGVCTPISRTNSSGGTTGGSSGGSGGFVQFTASDGSIVTGPPLDADCNQISFDEIVARAGVIFYSNQASYQSQNITISTIIRNMNCGPGGTLPTTYP